MRYLLASPQLAGRLALVGLAIYFAGIGYAMVYGGIHPRAYSPLNHFVSELSCPTLSPKAWVMNVGISVGSLLICPMILALGKQVQTRLSAIATLLGLMAAISAMLLGTSPMEVIIPHLVFAMGFFVFSMVEVALFTTALWMKYSFKHAPFLLGVGILTTLLAGGFLALLTLAAIFLTPPHFNLHRVVADFLAHSDRQPRPSVWSSAVLEWSVVISTFGWIAASAVYLLNPRVAGTVRVAP